VIFGHITRLPRGWYLRSMIDRKTGFRIAGPAAYMQAAKLFGMS
jgi:hypothetical protein